MRFSQLSLYLETLLQLLQKLKTMALPFLSSVFGNNELISHHLVVSENKFFKKVRRCDSGLLKFYPSQRKR